MYVLGRVDHPRIRGGILALRYWREVKIQDGGREQQNICHSQSINRKLKYVEEDFIVIRVLKKREGFTLIELMMVVAVIGILVAVLVPRIGATKNEARMSGIDTNVRTVQSAIESNIGRFQRNDANNPTNFATRISNASNGLQNPLRVVAQNGVTSATVPTTAPATAVVAITDATVAAPTTADADLAGTLVVTCTIDANNAIVNATITPYDDQGTTMPTTVVNR